MAVLRCTTSRLGRVGLEPSSLGSEVAAIEIRQRLIAFQASEARGSGRRARYEQGSLSTLQ